MIIAGAATVIAAVLVAAPVGGAVQSALLSILMAGSVSLTALHALFFAMKPVRT